MTAHDHVRLGFAERVRGGQHLRGTALRVGRSLGGGDPGFERRGPSVRLGFELNVAAPQTRSDDGVPLEPVTWSLPRGSPARASGRAVGLVAPRPFPPERASAESRGHRQGRDPRAPRQRRGPRPAARAAVVVDRAGVRPGRVRAGQRECLGCVLDPGAGWGLSGSPSGTWGERPMSRRPARAWRGRKSSRSAGFQPEIPHGTQAVLGAKGRNDDPGGRRSSCRAHRSAGGAMRLDREPSARGSRSRLTAGTRSRPCWSS